MKIKRYLLLLLLASSVFAQQKQLVTSIDTTKNKIGAEFKLTLKATVDTKSKVVFPKLKNMGALEVIQSYPIDTVKKDDRYELIKKYGLTQFDSGKYTIPSIKILINNKIVASDSIQVEVANVQVDTLKQKMFDIKDIAPADNSLGNWWKYLLGLLLVIGLAALIYWFVKKYKRKKSKLKFIKRQLKKRQVCLIHWKRKNFGKKEKSRNIIVN